MLRDARVPLGYLAVPRIRSTRIPMVVGAILTPMNLIVTVPGEADSDRDRCQEPHD